MYSNNSNCTKNGSFPLRTSLVNVNKKTADLFTFTKEILNGKLHFFVVSEVKRPKLTVHQMLWPSYERGIYVQVRLYDH